MYKLGDIITVTIVGIKTYGVFILDRNGRKGLIHVSECDDGFVKNLKNTFSIGEKVKAVVMEDDGNKKFSLSIRSLKETKGNLSKYPKPSSLYVGHKRYWTKSHYVSGFKPLEVAMNDWKKDKLK
jgi:general stress protein 13